MFQEREQERENGPRVMQCEYVWKREREGVAGAASISACKGKDLVEQLEGKLIHVEISSAREARSI